MSRTWHRAVGDARPRYFFALAATFFTAGAFLATGFLAGAAFFAGTFFTVLAGAAFFAAGAAFLAGAFFTVLVLAATMRFSFLEGDSCFARFASPMPTSNRQRLNHNRMMNSPQ